MSNLSQCLLLGLPRWLSGKESPTNEGDAGDWGLIPALGRSPGEGNGNPLQYSPLGNAMNRGAWWATVHGVTKSRTQLKRLKLSLSLHQTYALFN